MKPGEKFAADKLFPSLGMGIGLRGSHYAHILSTLPAISWFEAISENYMGIAGGSGGRPLHTLESIRKHYPIVLHGVSMSIGSTDPLNYDYLAKLKSLASQIEPSWISDHLCWTGVEGKNLHDLLPLPYTEEAIKHVADRISEVQDYLGRRILIENVSSYLTYRHSEMTEWEFIEQIVTRADCGILLDVNNIYVSSVNHSFDPETFLNGIPVHRVGQFHLAGHSNMGTHLIDTHDAPVCDEVWKLYEKAVRRFGLVSTLLEWDDKIPEFNVLEEETERARQVARKALTNDDDSRPTALPWKSPKVDAVDHYRP